MTRTNTELKEAASRKDRGRLCIRSCTGSTPQWPESTGSMEISFVTSKNVNGKEVQAFGSYGSSDWKIPWPKYEVVHLLVRSMAHTILSLGNAVLGLFCSKARRGGEEARRRRKRALAVPSRRCGPIRLHQTKLKPCHVEIGSQDSKKKKEANIEGSACTGCMHGTHKAELCERKRMKASMHPPSIGRGWLGLLVLVWQIQSAISEISKSKDREISM